MYYNINRDYRPSDGRYVQADPIGLAGGINSHQYVGSNPLRWIDILGLATINPETGEILPTRVVPTPIDPITGSPIGRVIVDPAGNAVIEPVGGRTIAFPQPGRPDTHTLYPNGSNCYRVNPQGHANNPTPHEHAHQPGVGPGKSGQGPSLSIQGAVVPSNSAAAHIPLRPRLPASVPNGVGILALLGLVVNAVATEQCEKTLNADAKLIQPLDACDSLYL